MTVIPNNQVISPQASGTLLSAMAPVFKAQMDTVLLGGRNITLNLSPGQTECPSGCRYNSTYNRYLGLDGKACRGCAGRGFLVEPRQTIYLANIRWTNEPLPSARAGGEDSPGGRVSENLIRTKTVIESLDHIKSALSANIDGVDCVLWEEPRPHGWGGQLFYVTAFWKKSDKT
ncbi:MAG: hypothetical protein ACXABY_02325 [Candidatus Thorarchaeota archaeon]|jgi:hypothetical protein